MHRLLWFLLVMVALFGSIPQARTRGPAPCEITTRSAQIGAGTIVYNTVGSGPTLLLIHGLFASKEQWNAAACQLAASGYTALAVDLPGYGKSDGFPLPDYRLERQVDLLHTLMQRLGVERLDIAGSSMGGAIATLYAARYRGEVRSLAFIGSPLGIVGWASGVRDAIYRGVNPFIPIDAQEFALELRLLFVQPPEIPAAEREAIVADYVARNRHFVQVWNIVNLYDDALARAGVSKLPTLIVWGTEDRIYDIIGAEQLRRRMPGSTLHRLPGAGHLLLMENASQAASIYTGFLRSHVGR
ncbi:MAG: alpha/beta hydrolase [Burkholderiales bacterium]